MACLLEMYFWNFPVKTHPAREARYFEISVGGPENEISLCHLFKGLKDAPWWEDYKLEFKSDNIWAIYGIKNVKICQTRSVIPFKFWDQIWNPLIKAHLLAPIHFYAKIIYLWVPTEIRKCQAPTCGIGFHRENSKNTFLNRAPRHKNNTDAVTFSSCFGYFEAP